jgi:hypothetical protein
MGRQVRRTWRLGTQSLVGVLVVVVVAAANVAGTASAAQAVVSHDDSLSGVSCVGVSSCVAVGTYEISGTQYALAEHWTGHRWSLMTVPNPSDTYMSGVSCTSATTCWAVTNPDNGIVKLQGNKWKGVSSPGVEGIMYGISCTTPPEACSAVGTEYVPMGEWGGVAESWQKPGAWDVSGSFPPSTTSPDISIAGVSCTSGSDCMAVGSQEYVASYSGGSVTWGEEPIVESWDGSNWTGLTAQSEGTDSGLSAVSCDSPSECMAVGYSGTGAFVENWNGTDWSIATNPSSSALNGVSCVSSAFCAAVGAGELGTWNGTSWSLAGSKTSAGTFNGVSCTSTSNCMAVGASNGATRTAHWNGKKWSVVSSVNRQ